MGQAAMGVLINVILLMMLFGWAHKTGNSVNENGWIFIKSMTTITILLVVAFILYGITKKSIFKYLTTTMFIFVIPLIVAPTFMMEDSIAVGGFFGLGALGMDIVSIVFLNKESKPESNENSTQDEPK